MTEAAPPPRSNARVLLFIIAAVVSVSVGGVAKRARYFAANVASASDSPPPGAMGNMPGMNESTPVSPAGASSSAVCITPARQQLIGVRTGLVERQSVSGTVRTVGILAYDETRVAVLAISLGPLPIMWSHGAGSDVMKRIAAPMVGGVVTSFVLELLIYPILFTRWKRWRGLEPTAQAAVRGVIEPA